LAAAQEGKYPPSGRLKLFSFGGLDEFPEFRIFLQRLIFTDLDAGTKEEILECVPAHDAMNQHAERVALKVNAVVADAEAVQDVPVAFQFAEILQFAAHDLLWQAAEVAENLQLQFLGHSRQLGRGGRREDDLKGAHRLSFHRTPSRQPRRAKSNRLPKVMVGKKLCFIRRPSVAK